MLNTIIAIICHAVITTVKQNIRPGARFISGKHYVNVKDYGAKGDSISDDTQAIKDAISFAGLNKPAAVYFPQGYYLIKQEGIKQGILKLKNGVSLIGAGLDKSHLVLSGGRKNPNSIFYQDWQEEPSVNNVVISGIDFNGSLNKQNFDPEYQFCHALSINNGKNIEVKNCKFQSFRGDGLLFGDTFEQKLNARIVLNVAVHHCEFVDIYREGALFCCVNGANFHHNKVHGNGYLVGAVDIERHSVNETVVKISVYNNIFDFREGYGPIERGRLIKYRRAVTIGYFYDGYKNGIADSLSGYHHIYNNKIYQGQIDCFGHLNVKINNNTIVNSFEIIKDLLHVSSPAINISDARATAGLLNVTVNYNYIESTIPGNGIVFYKYKNITSKHNTLKGPNLGGVMLINAEGNASSNRSEK